MSIAPAVVHGRRPPGDTALLWLVVRATRMRVVSSRGSGISSRGLVLQAGSEAASSGVWTGRDERATYAAAELPVVRVARASEPARAGGHRSELEPDLSCAILLLLDLRGHLHDLL